MEAGTRSEDSSHQEGNGNQGREKEGMSGNRIKLVTAVKLQPQNSEQTFLAYKEGKRH